MCRLSIYVCLILHFSLNETNKKIEKSEANSQLYTKNVTENLQTQINNVRRHVNRADGNVSHLNHTTQKMIDNLMININAATELANNASMAIENFQPVVKHEWERGELFSADITSRLRLQLTCISSCCNKVSFYNLRKDTSCRSDL